MTPNSQDQSPTNPIRDSLSVVVGGNQGIGAAIAAELGRRGSRVAIAGRNPATLDETLGALRSAGVTASSTRMDVTDVDAIRSGCAEIVDAHGPPRLLVNAAGGALKKDALDVSPEEWDQLVDTHLRGTFFTCQAFGRSMVAQGYGKVVNLSSTWGATVARGRSVYSAAKAGVTHLTAALGVEWGPLGVRVNAVAPTATMTPRVRERHEADPTAAAYSRQRIPLGRLAEVEDVVDAVMYLASASSDFITGQTLYVDGGWQHAK